MTVALVVLGVVAAVGHAAAILQVRQATKERGLLIDEWSAERTHLIDVIVARHAGDLRTLMQARRTGTPASDEVASYEATRNSELEAMGYDPKDVPRVPHGLDGG